MHNNPSHNVHTHTQTLNYDTPRPSVRQPLEHKWIVRICLQKLELGIGSKSVIKKYHPLAENIYNENNSLKKVCTVLSDPEWVRRKEKFLRARRAAIRDENR